MTARLWTHRNREPDSMFPHALMFGDRILRAFRSEDRSPNNYAEFCAIEAQLAPLVDLPDGVELRPTATGAWLREHGEGWEFLRYGWSADRSVLDSDWRYVVRRVPEPPAPETEKVPWWEAKDRLRPDGSIISRVGNAGGGPWFSTASEEIVAVPDGMVEVLKD